MTIPDKWSMKPRQVLKNPAFRRWFGASVLHHPDGAPMTLYHWTTASFTKFKPGGRNPRLSGEAIWLAPDARSAQAAHNIIHGKYENGQLVPDVRARVALPEPFNFEVWEGTNIIPVYARVERPLIIPLHDRGAIDRLLDAGLPAAPYYLTDADLKAAKAAGHDGIIAYKHDAPGEIDEVVVFSAGQVKSAIGNRGTYSRASHDLLAGVKPSEFLYHGTSREAAQRIRAGGYLLAGGPILDDDADIFYAAGGDAPEVHSAAWSAALGLPAYLIAEAGLHASYWTTNQDFAEDEYASPGVLLRVGLPDSAREIFGGTYNEWLIPFPVPAEDLWLRAGRTEDDWVPLMSPQAARYLKSKS